MSCLMGFVSCIACHLSLTPTTTATEPPPSNSPVIPSLTRSLQSNEKQDATHNTYLPASKYLQYLQYITVPSSVGQVTLDTVYTSEAKFSKAR